MPGVFRTKVQTPLIDTHPPKLHLLRGNPPLVKTLIVVDGNVRFRREKTVRNSSNSRKFLLNYDSTFGENRESEFFHKYHITIYD